MRRGFAGGFIVSSLKKVWKCTALIISLFDPTNDNDIKNYLYPIKNGDWNKFNKLLFSYVESFFRFFVQIWRQSRVKGEKWKQKTMEHR